MNCDFCGTPGVTWEERPQNDLQHLECRNCGTVELTDHAYAKIAQLDADERQLLAKHFREHPANKHLTEVGLRDLVEELKTAGNAALLRAELDKTKEGSR